MRDAELRAIASGLIEAALNERRRFFTRETERVVGEAVGEGRLSSGFLVEDLADHFSREAQVRIREIWAVLHRVVTTVGLPKDEDLSVALRGFVVQYFSSELEVLQQELERRLDGALNTSRALAHLKNVADSAVTAIRWEIDLFLRSVTPHQGSPLVQHVYQAPVGNVVSGGSVSIGTQYVQGDHRELLASIDGLRQDLSQVNESLVPDKDTILEILADAREELGSGRPRKLKLFTLLSGVGVSIRTIPAIDPAYQAVRAAAIKLGILLS